jgi:hypothetical protein
MGYILRFLGFQVNIKEEFIAKNEAFRAVTAVLSYLW